MKSTFLATFAVLAGLLAGPARAQDGGGGAPPPVPPAAPPADAKKPPKEPSSKVASRIEESLKGCFAGSTAARLAARAALDAAVEEWAADAKDDPLRDAKWWRAALASTLPTASRRTGLSEEKYAYLENREARLWVSVPRAYAPAKGASPMVLAILDRGEDPRRLLPALYGDLLKEWIVVAIVADPKEAGIDIVKEPWLVAVGLRWAVENLRVDRDRVVLDGTAGVSNLALSLAAEWAVQFAGCILRGPTVSTPLLSNLGLCGAAVVTPEVMTEPHKKILEELRAAAPAAVVVPDGKGSAEAVQKWLGALAPRRITAAETTSISWKTRPQGGEPWACWLWVFRAAEAKKERLVSVTITRDPAAGLVSITGDNLAEGRLLLNDDLVDLGKDVAVKVNGREVWRGKVERSVKTALYWIGQTGERTLWAPAEVRFTVPADATSPPPAKKEAGSANPPAPGKNGGAPPGDAPKKEAPAAAPGGKGGG
jgi:hypothetical protein